MANDKKFELQLLLCNILHQTLHMKLFMHLLYARSATIGHEVRYAITLIKLTFLFTFQVRAGYTVNIYMYKTIEARVNTVAIPTTGKSYIRNSFSLYWQITIYW